MASSTDSFVNVLLGAVVVVLLAAGQSGGSTTPNSTGSRPGGGATAVPNSTASTNIPGGPLIACSGQLLSTDTVEVGEGGGLTLQVFYSAVNGGRNCTTVTKTGTARQQRGELVTTLQFHSYDGRRWPRYAIRRSPATATRSDGVYIDRTDDRCVRGWARFKPDRGRSVSVTSGKVGCR